MLQPLLAGTLASLIFLFTRRGVVEADGRSRVTSFRSSILLLLAVSYMGLVSQNAVDVVVGLGFGVFMCRGSREVTEGFRWLRAAWLTVENHEQRSIITSSICLLLSILAAAVAAPQGTRIPPEKGSLELQVSTLMLLFCGLIQELGGLRHLICANRVRSARLGAKQELLMSLEDFPSKENIEASYLMSVVYLILLIIYYLLYKVDLDWNHQDPVLLRPVCTLRYVEWSVVVPILLWICGRLHLRQPIQVVLPPILQTVSYIWLAWVAHVSEAPVIRIFMVVACFVVVGASFLGMWKWARADRCCESGLLLFINVVFGVYGIVYLLSWGNLITVNAEEMLYTAGDVVVKLTITSVSSSFTGNAQLDSFYSCVNVYLDLMVGMRALVGSQFDLVINCKVSPAGLVLTDTNTMLEKYTGRKLAGRYLEEICASEVDRARLRHMRNNSIVRNGSRENKSPWDRQEAIYQMAEMIRVDLIWVFSLSGIRSVDLFVAAPAVQGANGDDVLIGVRLSQEEPNSFQERAHINKPSKLAADYIDGEESGSEINSFRSEQWTIEQMPPQQTAEPPPVRRRQPPAQQPRAATQQAAARPSAGGASARFPELAAEVKRQSWKPSPGVQLTAAETALSELLGKSKQAEDKWNLQRASLQQQAVSDDLQDAFATPHEIAEAAQDERGELLIPAGPFADESLDRPNSGHMQPVGQDNQCLAKAQADPLEYRAASSSSAVVPQQQAWRLRSSKRGSRSVTSSSSLKSFEPLPTVIEAEAADCMLADNAEKALDGESSSSSNSSRGIF